MELLDKLRQREAERKLSEKTPEYLTDDEKRLSMDQLFRKWKLERQRKREEREQLRISDFEPLGQLTDDQMLLPRRDVQRIVNNRKNQVWAKSMQDKGIAVHTCDTCHQMYTHDKEKHMCLQTRWQAQSSNPAVSRTLIVTQSPGGLRLRSADVVDEENLQSEFKKLKTLTEEVASRQRLVESNPPSAPDQTDTAMSHAVTTSSPSSNSRV